MTKREKVINGLELCDTYGCNCDGCPYSDPEDADGCHAEELIKDALALVREQDPVKPELVANLWLCGNCHQMIGIETPNGNSAADTKYCKYCGRAIEWKDPEPEEEQTVKYVLTGHIETDGDFSINMNKMGDGDSIDYHDGFDRFIKLGDHCYDIDLRTDDVYLVRDFLEELIVSFDVSSTHYSLLNDLYHMVEDVLDDVFIDYIEYSVGECSGNYEGTKLELVKQNV